MTERQTPRIRIRIKTPSRLHFGLLSWNPQAPRQFGGVGLMIASPGVDLSADPTPRWSAEGPLAERVRELLSQIRNRQDESIHTPLEPVHIRVHRAPEEHIGLGVGTQLSLGVVQALLALANIDHPSQELLARLSGRGRRSGIGLHGFALGGLIVDGGRKNEDGIPPLLSRMPFPEDWSILIVRPPGNRGLHGDDEVKAFANLPPFPSRLTERLCRLVVLDLLPAVSEHDLEPFGAAVEELQERVGACFARFQGGRYATPQSVAIRTELKRHGLSGVGQSSWGPSLYGFARLTDGEHEALAEELRKTLALDESSLFWTRPNNHGAMIDRLNQ